jgi:hypothetical protein
MGAWGVAPIVLTRPKPPRFAANAAGSGRPVERLRNEAITREPDAAIAPAPAA